MGRRVKAASSKPVNLAPICGGQPEFLTSDEMAKFIEETTPFNRALLDRILTGVRFLVGSTRASDMDPASFVDPCQNNYVIYNGIANQIVEAVRIALPAGENQPYLLAKIILADDDSEIAVFGESIQKLNDEVCQIIRSIHAQDGELVSVIAVNDGFVVTGSNSRNILVR